MSGPSGILGYKGKQNTVKDGARGMRIVALFISSHERTHKTESVVYMYCRFSLYLKDPFPRLFHQGKFKIIFMVCIRVDACGIYLSFALAFKPEKCTM